MSTLTATLPHTKPQAAGRKVYLNPVIGDKLVFLKTARETGGAYTLVEIELAAGGGNMPHIHRAFSETFIPLEGTLGVRSGREKLRLHPGQVHTVPPGTPHYFHNPSDQPVRFQVELRPGHEGFENSLKIAYGLAGDGLTNGKGVPRNPMHLSVVGILGDTYLPGPLALLMPLFRWLARRARRNGVEKELLQRYCG
ncbi:MAG TPA: cupin domain-containing protein [Cytophagales bacterium]